MEGQLVSIFGKRGFPVRRYWRMMYWMPKFKNVSPWPVPKPPPENPLELAKMAISRISDVDLETQVSCYKVRVYIIYYNSMIMLIYFFFLLIPS